MSGPTRIAIVSDDDTWMNALRVALRDCGVDAQPSTLLHIDLDYPVFPVLLLDSRLEPIGGVELAVELHALLGDACPPLLLARLDDEPVSSEAEGLFAAVLPRSAEPSQLAMHTARALARMPAASGFVLRSSIAQGRSAEDD